MPELFTALQQQVLALQQCVGVSGNAFWWVLAIKNYVTLQKPACKVGKM